MIALSKQGYYFMIEQGQRRVGGNASCLFVHRGGMVAPVCYENRVWEARQVGTAARPAIENVVIAANSCLCGHFNRIRALTKKSPKVFRDAPKTTQ